MLEEISISAAEPLARLMASKGTVLSVQTDSILSALVNASTPVEAEVVVDGETVVVNESPAEAVQEASSLEAYDGSNEHGIVMAAAIETLSSEVRALLSLAQGTVLPEIQAITDKVKAAADEKVSNSRLPMVVMPQYLDDVFTRGELRNDLDGFAADTPVNVEPVQLTAKWQDGSLHSGIADYDQALDKYLADKQDKVQDTWQRYFSNTPGLYRPNDVASDLVDHDKALVIYQGAKRLLADESVPDGLSISLVDYRSYLARLMARAGFALSYWVKHEEAVRKANQLVRSAPMKYRPSDRPMGDIEVNGEVYNRWLKEGGSPEALYGAVASGSDLSYQGLLSKKDDTAREWSSLQTTKDAKVRFEYQAYLVEALRDALVAKAKSVVEGDLSTDLYNRLNERMEEFHIAKVEDLYMVVRKAVCKLFYPSSAVEEFLKLYDHVAEAKTTEDPRETGLVALIIYLTRKVSDGIVVAKA